MTENESGSTGRQSRGYGTPTRLGGGRGAVDSSIPAKKEKQPQGNAPPTPKRLAKAKSETPHSIMSHQHLSILPLHSRDNHILLCWFYRVFGWQMGTIIGVVLHANLTYELAQDANNTCAHVLKGALLKNDLVGHDTNKGDRSSTTTDPI